jgi:hypothetical protein
MLHQPFPIVGIGASAGGVEALEVLFQDLPPDSGMAFVLVTHLPVGYETSLPDILGRHSAMAVTIAGNGEAIEPNHVYVCPSGSTLTVKEGRLVLSPLGSAPIPNLVDALLYSLAEDRGEQAIGVVLSGCESAYHLIPNRLPTVTLVRCPINSSTQCVAVRGLGSDLHADRASDPRPNNTKRSLAKAAMSGGHKRTPG